MWVRLVISTQGVKASSHSRVPKLPRTCNPHDDRIRISFALDTFHVLPASIHRCMKCVCQLAVVIQGVSKISDARISFIFLIEFNRAKFTLLFVFLFLKVISRSVWFLSRTCEIRNQVYNTNFESLLLMWRWYSLYVSILILNDFEYYFIAN